MAFIEKSVIMSDDDPLFLYYKFVFNVEMYLK